MRSALAERIFVGKFMEEKAEQLVQLIENVHNFLQLVEQIINLEIKSVIIKATKTPND